jgi:hypothetical protein
VKTSARQGSGPTTFLVEHYWPGITADRFQIAAERVRKSAGLLADEGVCIRFLHSTLVPEDEAAFCVFAADSQAAVEEAYTRAGVPYERVLDALEIGVANTFTSEKEE